MWRTSSAAETRETILDLKRTGKTILLTALRETLILNASLSSVSLHVAVLALFSLLTVPRDFFCSDGDSTRRVLQGDLRSTESSNPVLPQGSPLAENLRHVPQSVGS